LEPNKSKRKVPLGPSDLFALRFLRGARLSPDGCRVAYAVSRIDGEEQIEIWIADLSDGNPQRLPYPGNASSPRWSPDGRRIAFVGDGRMYVATLPSLILSEPLTPETLSVSGPASWSADGTRLAVSLLAHQQAEDVRFITSRDFRADGFGFLDGLSQRIYEIDCETSHLRCLTPGGAFCMQPEWSPCGQYILFLGNDGAKPFADYSPRLLTVAVNDGEIRELLGVPWFIASAHWLPNNERIVVVATHGSDVTVPTLGLWVISRSGTEEQLRTADVIGNVGFRTQHDMPARDLTHGNTVAVLDSNTAFVSVQRGGSVEIWRVALDGAVEADRLLTGARSCIALDVHGGAGVLLYAETDLRSPPELWKCTLDGVKEVRLTNLNGETLEHWPEITIEDLRFASADGTNIEGWLMASVESVRPLPTVLFIHGGPFGAAGHAFCYDFQLLASQGFGLVFANFRGSAGYGESFARAIMGDWGRRAYPDHIGAADAAVARGFADPARLGVWGHSYGGFATCWIVGHSNRFKAAVAEAACTNLETLYYLTDVPEVFRYDMGGRPHEIPDLYRACSPITYAHRCTTPTLLVHGEDDLRCPISEAEQFYRALRDAGCTTALLRIPGCSHLGDSLGPLSVRRTQNEALLAWFQKYL
jgi:dipeptidyl aminopeptidase/acylaminoacyl peptidase